MKPIYSNRNGSSVNIGHLMVVLLLSSLTMLCTDVTAATYNWNGSGAAGGTNNTNFNLASNWLVGGVAPATPPGSGDDVVINPNNFNSLTLNSGSCVISSSVTINSLTCNTVFPTTSNVKKTMTISVSANQTLTISGDLSLSCVHNVITGTSSLDFLTGSSSSVVVGGTATIGNSSATGSRLVKIGGSTSATANTIVFNGNTTLGAQASTSTAAPYSKWIFSGASQTLSCSAVSANFSFSSVDVGTNSIATDLSLGSSSFNVSGDWNNYGTTNQSSGTVTFNGASAQTIGGTAASTFSSVTLNNASGLSLSRNLSVGGLLTMTSGKITTSTNSVIVGNGGSISGASSSNYIVGNLSMPFAASANPSATFPIGDASNYTPVTVSVTGTLSAAGSVTASSTPSAHPNILTSGIDSTSISRYYTLSSAGLSGMTSYAAFFNFVAGDVPAWGNTSNFVVRKRTSGTWGTTTLGAAASTSTSATGMTTFGDFAIGKPNYLSISCPGTQNINTDAGVCFRNHQSFRLSLLIQYSCSFGHLFHYG